MLSLYDAQALDISGNVWQDQNSNAVFNPGEGTNAGGPLYVNLVNTNGVVVNSALVNNNGTYTITGVANNRTNFKLVLTNTPTNPIGNRVPRTFYSVSETIGTGNSAAQTGSLLGEINITVTTANATGQNFRLGEQTPFGCQDGMAYQVALNGAETVSSLYSYNIATGARSRIAATQFVLNSLIYSSASDNILWATISSTGNDIARIGAGGVAIPFTINNLPTTGFVVGSELPNGYMMVLSSGTNYYVIDVDPSRSTYLELVDPKNGYVKQNGPQFGSTVTGTFNVSDMAYMSATQLCYGITPAAMISTLNPATGVATTNSTPVSGLPAAPYGGIFSDQAGKLYTFNNNTGAFYKIDPIANSATLISTSIPSGNNDATSCPFAVVECDTDIESTPATPVVCSGTTTTFTVAPSGNGPFTYRWQLSTNGGNTWTDMQTTPFTGPNGTYSGAETNTLTVTPSTAVWNGYQYRAQVTSNLCTIPSSASLLTVYAIPGTPILSANSAKPVCPADTYNLNTLVSSTTPTGSTLNFYTSSTPSPATKVADPTIAPTGTYYAIYENQGCSGAVSQPITIEPCSLPVTLTSFSVTKENADISGTATLKWTTTMETNSDHFAVERSMDGKIWKVIGIQPSHVTSSQLQSYTFSDSNPESGLNYYRLKMVDRDNTFAYSRIQSAEFGSVSLNVYPNPVSERLFIKNFSKVKSVIIRNSAGAVVYQNKAITADGVDVSILNNGLYIVNMIHTDGSSSAQNVIINK